MWKQSRRDFLVSSAAGALALPAGMVLAAPSSKPADMAIARWAGHKDLSNAQIDQAAGKMTEEAMEALGGMKRFVKRGDVVWIKPNIGWDRRPEQAANTNPQIVAALVRLALDAGAKTVKVGDNPVHPAVKTYESSGIAAAAKAAGAKVVFLDPDPLPHGGHRRREGPRDPRLPRDYRMRPGDQRAVGQASRAVEPDDVHEELPGRSREAADFPPGPARLHCRHHPLHEGSPARLHLLEGVRILTGHGPTGGNLADVQVKMTLAAGTDIVALDAWARS